jgi:hypothetical protein
MPNLQDTVPLTWLAAIQSSKFEFALEPVNHCYRLQLGLKIQCM